MQGAAGRERFLDLECASKFPPLLEHLHQLRSFLGTCFPYWHHVGVEGARPTKALGGSVWEGEGNGNSCSQRPCRWSRTPTEQAGVGGGGTHSPRCPLSSLHMALGPALFLLLCLHLEPCYLSQDLKEGGGGGVAGVSPRREGMYCGVA